MSPPQSQSSDSADEALAKQIVVKNGDRKIRMRFLWAEDRFSHVIELGDASGSSRWEPVFWSLEGTPQDRCPPSPAFQEVERHEHVASSLLCVGGAGTLYWSASVDPLADGIRVDVACRVKEDSDLSSRYTLAPAANGQTLDSSPKEFDDHIRLTADSTNCEITDKDGEFAIHPTGNPEKFPATVRWSYRFLFASAE